MQQQKNEYFPEGMEFSWGSGRSAPESAEDTIEHDQTPDTLTKIIAESLLQTPQAEGEI